MGEKTFQNGEKPKQNPHNCESLIERLLKDTHLQNKRGNPERGRHENHDTWTPTRERSKGASNVMAEPKRGSHTGAHTRAD